jgi:hypothetical protein
MTSINLLLTMHAQLVYYLMKRLPHPYSSSIAYGKGSLCMGVAYL